MLLKNSKRILSAVLAVILFALSLPMIFGGSAAITVSADGQTTIDYTTAAAVSKYNYAEIAWYVDTLGMHDGAALLADGQNGLYPDNDVIYKMETDKYIAKSGPFAEYKIVPNTAFSATFASGSNVELVDILISTDGGEWYPTNPTVNGTTLSIENAGDDINFVKIQWPCVRSAENQAIILSSVTCTKAQRADNEKFYNYGAISSGGYNMVGGTTVSSAGGGQFSDYTSKGVWDSKNIYSNPTANGTLSASYDRLSKATSGVDTYVLYKVQPGTRFSITVTNNADYTDAIATALKYEDPTRYTVTLFGGADQWDNYTELDVEPNMFWRAGSYASKLYRSYEYDFIVPEGVHFIKCQFPQDGNVSKKVGTNVYKYVGNDIIFIEKVEFTENKADFDYGFNSYDTYNGYDSANTGIDAMGNITYNENANTGAQNGYAPSYISGTKTDNTQIAYVQYNNVMPGTPFSARFNTSSWWDGIVAWLNAYALNDTTPFTAQQGYTVKLQGYDTATLSWVTVDSFKFVLDDPTAAAPTIANANKRFYEYLSLSAQNNTFEKLRITWPFVGSSAVASGNNFALLDEVNVTKYDTLYDFTAATSSDSDGTLSCDTQTYMYNNGIVDYNNNDNKPKLVSGSGIQAHWNMLNAKTGRSKLFMTFDIKGSEHIFVDFARSNDQNSTDRAKYKDLDVLIYTSETYDFADSTLFTVTHKKYRDTSNGYNCYAFAIDVPENHNFMKIVYPQTGSTDVGASWAGNDLFTLKTVKISGKNEKAYFSNYQNYKSNKNLMTDITAAQNITAAYNTSLKINAVSWNTNHIPAIHQTNGIQANYSKLVNATAASPVEKCWLIFDASGGEKVELLVDKTVNVDYYAAPVVYTSATADFTSAVGRTVNVGSPTYIDMPAGHSYLKFEFQQTTKNENNSAAGNDYYSLRYLGISGKNNYSNAAHENSIASGDYRVNTDSNVSFTQGNAVLTSDTDTPAYLPIDTNGTIGYYKMENRGKIYKVSFNYTATEAAKACLVATNGKTQRTDSKLSPEVDIVKGTGFAELYYQLPDGASGKPYNTDNNRYLLIKTYSDVSAGVAISDIEISEVASNSVNSSSTASVLTEAVALEKNKQAIRFYATYKINSDGKLEFSGVPYTVLERGMLVRGYKASNTEEMTVNSTSAQALKLSKTDFLQHYYWTKDDDTGAITYSYYIDGFAVDATAKLEVRAYVIVQDDNGNKLVFYSNHHAASVSDLKSAGAIDGTEGKAPTSDSMTPTPPQNGKNYTFDGSISLEVLNNYLDRTLTSMFLGEGNVSNFKQVSFESGMRTVKTMGAKYVQRAVAAWVPDANEAQVYDKMEAAIAELHEYDPEIILEACIFENITEAVNNIPVPDYCFTVRGEEVEQRNFRLEDMIFEDGYGKDLLGTNCYIPDISRPETQRFFYYRAVTYIDMGFEALHLGQAALMGKNDSSNYCWTYIVNLIRSYAKQNARRHYVILNAHYPSQTFYEYNASGEYPKMLMDFNSFPLRLEVAEGQTDHDVSEDNPLECDIFPGTGDAVYNLGIKGTSPSGWTTDDYPYLVEFDNYGGDLNGEEPNNSASESRWGYDEIAWYAAQPAWYRQYFYEYLYTRIAGFNENGHVSAPGCRCTPGVGANNYYYIDSKAFTAYGFGDEEAIRAVWDNAEK